MFLTPIIGWKNTAVSGAYSGSDTSTTNSTTVFTSTNLVPAVTSDSRIVAVITYASSNTRTVSSVTFSGVSGTQRVSVNEDNTDAAIWDAVVPSGAAGDLVVTLSAATGLGTLYLVSVYNLGPATYRTSGSDSTGTAVSVNTSVYTGEFVVGVSNAYYNFGGAGSITWSGLTEDYDVDLRDSRVSSASKSITADASLTSSSTVSAADDHVLAVAVYEGT